MPNGLHDNPELHEKSKDEIKSFIVGRYTFEIPGKESSTTVLLNSKFYFELRRSLIHGKKDCRWLSDDTIDLAAKIIIDKTDNYYIHSCVAKVLFNNSISISQLARKENFAFNNINLKSCNYVFTVLNVGAHWVLIVVNIRHATLYWMDPYKKGTTNPKYLKKWKDLILLAGRSH